jgi:hypothetical protein
MILLAERIESIGVYSVLHADPDRCEPPVVTIIFFLDTGEKVRKEFLCEQEVSITDDIDLNCPAFISFEPGQWLKIEQI